MNVVVEIIKDFELTEIIVILLVVYFYLTKMERRLLEKMSSFATHDDIRHLCDKVGSLGERIARLEGPNGSKRPGAGA